MSESAPLPHLDESGRSTLKTVAVLAGVHVSTVSRVLSPNLPAGTRAASPTTTARIRSIAHDVGFSRNPHAAGLRTRRSHLIGVLVPRLTDLVLSIIYEGIDDAARGNAYQAFVTDTHDDRSLRVDIAERLLARRVDGLILGDASVTDDNLARTLAGRGVPFVLVSRRSENYPSVTCDDYRGGRLAAEHLLELGHTTVAVVAGRPYASTAIDRTAGFRDTYREAGHPILDSLVADSSFDVHGGRKAAEMLLAQQVTPTAVFAVNDFAAIGVLGAVSGAGLRAGHDIAVVGYNDTPLAAQLPVPLTSVSSPMHEMGARSVQLLLDRIGDVPTPSVMLAPALYIRESSDPLAVGGRSPLTPSSTV